MTTKRDYYDVLGVSAQGVRGGHPKSLPTEGDGVPPGPEQGERRLRALQRGQRGVPGAERTLNAASSTTAFGHPGVRNGAGQGAGGFEGFDIFGGFGDIFDAFFGSGAASRTRPRQGDDVRANHQRHVRGGAHSASSARSRSAAPSSARRARAHALSRARSRRRAATATAAAASAARNARCSVSSSPRRRVTCAAVRAGASRRPAPIARASATNGRDSACRSPSPPAYTTARCWSCPARATPACLAVRREACSWACTCSRTRGSSAGRTPPTCCWT